MLPNARLVAARLGSGIVRSVQSIPNDCPLCDGELEWNGVFYVCEACFTPFDPPELAGAWRERLSQGGATP